MMYAQNQTVSFDGHSYIPFLSCLVSAGPFLPVSLNRVESYLKVSLVHGVMDRCIGGVRTVRSGLIAARFYGDSMCGDDIRHNDIGIFQKWDFDYVQPGRIALIEKIGEEEGASAFAIKKIVVSVEPSCTRTEFAETADWNSPIYNLRSSNRKIPTWELDPKGEYRICGYFVRVRRPEH